MHNLHPLLPIHTNNPTTTKENPQAFRLADNPKFDQTDAGSAYTAGYTVFRFFIEGLRIDPANSAGGLRLNQWVSLAVFAASLAVIIAMRGRPAATEPALPESAD